MISHGANGASVGMSKMASMNVVVCVKRIPDPAAPADWVPNTHTLVREGKLIMDDSDWYGVRWV